MKLLLSERIILNVLSFDVIVEQPYITLITLSQSLICLCSADYSSVVNNDQIQYAWKFANDSSSFPCYVMSSVLSTVSIQYTAKTIAAACMYLSICGLKVMAPNDALPILLDICDADQSVLDSCCECLKALYPNFDTLFRFSVCIKHITLYNRYLVQRWKELRRSNPPTFPTVSQRQKLCWGLESLPRLATRQLFLSLFAEVVAMMERIIYLYASCRWQCSTNHPFAVISVILCTNLN